MRFAAGLDKWVEIRVGNSVPHLHSSMLPIKQTQYKLRPINEKDAWGYPMYAMKPVTTTYRRRQLAWSGGTLEEVLSRRAFRARFKQAPPKPGHFFELKEENETLHPQP